MDNQIDRFLDIAQRVSANAQQDTLSPDIAVQFCKWVLPALLVELEVAKRVSERLDSAFPAPPAAGQECEATICSSRWNKPAKKQRAPKKAARKSRKKKGVKDDCAAS